MLSLTHLSGFGGKRLGGDNLASSITMNPSDAYNITFTNGNLTVEPSSGWAHARSTSGGKSSGKWHWEAVYVSSVNSGETEMLLGVRDPSGAIAPASTWYHQDWTVAAAGRTYGYAESGLLITNASSGGSLGYSWTQNDVATLLLDLDALTLKVKKNGGSPTLVHNLAAGTYEPAVSMWSGRKFTFRFGGLTYPEPGYSTLQS